ncbi:thioredoxin family protein [Pseudonocardia sp. HH130630-07]|uniref:thioredoxin family protein n=1 Tax=Pseudonocardia sp. HH130630-07 TaxID=1690815 RepID=UPI003FA72909
MGRDQHHDPPPRPRRTRHAAATTQVHAYNLIFSNTLSANWCGPCQAYNRILEEVAAENSEKITVAKLDIDQNPNAPRFLRIQSLPTLLLFEDGGLSKRIVGLKP